MYVDQIIKACSAYNLLQHPFYQAWNEGKLTKTDLQEYACQYFRHVDDFPRYLSAMHSRCKDINIRQILLGNLVDEEQGNENHPELWLRFADSLGVSRDTVKNAKLTDETKSLTDEFFALSKSSLAEGIGALFAYEHQTPEIAKTKIDGLKKMYNISSEDAIKFFSVHISADEWHSEELANLIEGLSAEEKEQAKAGAVKLAKALWKFLDGVQSMVQQKEYLNMAA